ncbi:MAG: hypothetical protein PHP54_00465 [Clostridia bacterium]|nr:hypothetical protein [Clostridia bacterium]
MKKDKNLLIFLTILIFLIILFSALFYYQWKNVQYSEVTVQDFSKQYGYHVFQITSKENGILSEYFAITTKEGAARDTIVLDTRIIESGYSGEKSSERYELLNNFHGIVYNVTKTEGTISYNTSVNNGKSVYELINARKNYCKDVVVKEN